ncbi:hypothetical protein Q3G72_023811 [Acer saccharum]|nr:hypothetical protein Q3G72_023811 [Acer saccharum]
MEVETEKYRSELATVCAELEPWEKELILQKGKLHVACTESKLLCEKFHFMFLRLATSSLTYYEEQGSKFLNHENMQVIVSGILRVQNSKGSVIFKDGGWLHKIVMSLRKLAKSISL